MTELIRVDPEHPDADAIGRAAERLRRGGLVAFPTETVYGLGAAALDRDAVRRLFEAKGRPATDPVIVHVASSADIAPLVSGIPLPVDELAARFWPGPLTLILPRAAAVPDAVTAGLNTVGVRVPAHPVALALLRAAAIPVAAPSANLFSRPSPTRARHVLDDLDGRIDLVVDGGATTVGVESTVLDLSAAVPTVLRPGAVTLEMLRAVLPDVTQRSVASPGGEAMTSPGQLSKHYSPRAPLTLYEGTAARAVPRLLADAEAAIARGQRPGLLVTSDVLREIGGDVRGEPERPPGFHLIDIGPADEPAVVANRLYTALREMDSANVDLILARVVPAESGLGVALADRLRRAAAGRIVRCD